MNNLRLGPGLLRIVLASMVVVSHLLPIQIGRVAVAAFFTLSGYWVVVMYVRKYALAPNPIRSFYTSRVMRIFPTYWAVLALTILGLAALGDMPRLALTDYTVLGIASAAGAVVWPAWSLDVELQFYLFAPLIFLALGATPGAAKAAMFVLVAAVITALAWIVGPQHIFLKVAAYALPFALGGYAALRQVQVDRTLAMVSLALFIAIGVVGLLVPSLHWIIHKSVHGPLDRDLFAMLWSLVLTPFIFWNVRLPSGKLDRALGDLAFTLYLCHWFFTNHYGEIFQFVGNRWLRFVCGALAIYVTTMLVYFGIERPVEHLRRRLLTYLASPSRSAKRIAPELNPRTE